MRDLRRIPLPPDGWTVRAGACRDSSAPACEPIGVAPFAHASIHAVLAHAGVQRPWAHERAELDSEWVGRTEWTFAREVDVPAVDEGRRCALSIESIDGPCEVLLDGVALGSHASEHFPFDAEVPESMRGARALLELRFKAPVDEVLRWQERLGARPVNGDWTPFCFARSAACGFGWDWGPRVPGVGFRGARFDCWNETRITGVSVAQRWNDDGSVAVRVTPQGEFDRARLVCIVREREGAQRVECDPEGFATIRPSRRWTTWDRRSPRDTPSPWWNAMVGMRDAAGAFRPIATTRFAPRHVELDTATDGIGRRFRFLLNGEPLFARGANLIPPLLGARHDHDWLGEMRRYRETGFNMVRVWGGGNYLPDAFYEACDELGILVWQDFMFACATYPEDEPFASLVAREAAHQVARLSCHPSLALWCGGNEDILAWWSWGWKDRLAQGQSWGLKYWLETLPAAVAAHDAGTPYWAESPYSGSMELHPNDPDHGDRHTWDAEAKIEGYRTILPRFSSEFGHQSPPCWQTVVEDCLDASRVPEAMSAAELVEALRLRQKAWGGDEVQYGPFLAARFREARSAREYVAQAQHLQARAMSVAMRWLRAGAPRSMGALIWQWNDVWAGHSWSLVDVAGRRKPAWDAVRRACAPRVLSIEPTGGFEQGRPGALEVVLSDDAAFLGPASFERASARAVVERMDFAGNVRARAAVDLVPFAACGLPAATLRGAIPSEILEGARRGHEMLVATVEGDASVGRAVELLGSDADLVLPPARFERVVGAAARVRAASV
ncbi:MAG: glycosyl hydrolase 2 galactose-binding domain-containing protein, partial [Phycisphaerales bacterium]